LEVGEEVQVLDDTISGTIVKVKGNNITILTGDGFQLDFDRSELILSQGREKLRVSNFEAAAAKAEKAIPKKPKSGRNKPRERNMPKMEVDLHIHHLVPSTRGMSNFDMLTIQLETAKRQLEFAMRKRIQKVVFIHGVGAGVLKEELHYLFRKYPNIDWFDADYQKYGLGATEIYIRQN
jgi:dsDNA-specific endonuclease/ATPase MutS2